MGVSLEYKIDWLSFSISYHDENGTLNTDVLEILKYDFEDFEIIPGRYFYNSGATIGNYVNVFWNDFERKKSKVSSNTMTVVFTGQGCTELAEKWNSDWISVFSILDEVGAKVTRLDIALDDYSESVTFDEIENKLNKGHYRSSKRSYNVVRSSDVNGKPLGRTIYIGKARANNSRGNVYARFYDKKAQYEEKHQLLPEKAWKSWQRYEISYTKKYAQKVVGELFSGHSVDKVFKTSLRQLLEILTPNDADSNKSRWKVSQWWERFLEYDEKMDFGIAERDVSLAEVLQWLSTTVLPSLAMLEELGEEKNFDIYEVLRLAEKPKLNKKQARLLNASKQLPEETIFDYLKKIFF